MKKELINYSYEKEYSTQRYLQNAKLKNLITRSEVNVTYNLKNKVNTDYFFLKSVFNYFSESYSDYEKIFITLTLPSYYHANKFAITKGYNLLQKYVRKFFKHLNKMKIEYKYVRVCEPHKDLTPHFHLVLYVKFPLRLIKIKNKYIKVNYSYLRNYFYFSKKGILGRCQFVKIVGDKGVQKYVSKYLAKTFDTTSDEFRIIDGWKRFFNIRMLSYSKLPIPKYLFKIAVNACPVSYTQIADNYADLYSYFMEHLDIFKDNKLVRKSVFSTYSVFVRYKNKKSIKDCKLPILTDFEINCYFNLHTKNEKIDNILLDLGKQKKDYFETYTKFNISLFNMQLFKQDLLDYYVEINEYKTVEEIYLIDNSSGFLLYSSSLQEFYFDKRIDCYA